MNELESQFKLTKDVSRHPFWSMSADETMKVLETSLVGLGGKDVEKRVKIFGKNAISEKPGFIKLGIFMGQFKSALIMVLVAAGVITVFLKEYVNTAVIFAAVFINVTLGFWQENKAENALELLKSYVRTRARVDRDGEEREIDAENLVPGDILRISQGDRVPADARVFFSNSLEVDESTITGESLPVWKNPEVLHAGTALADRKCMVYSGTLVVRGFADAVVTATGGETEFGRIATLVAGGWREKTPLQESIENFTIRSGFFLGALVLVLFMLGLYYGYGVFEMFIIAVAVAVSAVPEGLPVALTVILAVGVEKLAKRKGIVRKLLAAETLGSTSLILTDKTGTLTQAKMEVAAIVPYPEKNKEAEKKFLEDALLNTDLIIENPTDPPEFWRAFGHPLDIALARRASADGLDLSSKLKRSRQLNRLPFTSENRYSASVVKEDGGAKFIVFGAPETVISFTTLEEAEKKKLHEEVDKRARAGQRVIAMASGRAREDHEKILHAGSFRGLDFKGFAAFHDPLRPEVAAAIRRIAEDGVKTKIVTGDHVGTAEAVARELGMIDGVGAVLTGEDLAYLKREEIMARSPEVAVFARVSPEQKLMIVNMYKEEGEVVAVTGDGINDAPALKAADIGAAVGSGTEVAKSASDLVLLDNNFETLVAAIEEGRRILDNIKKVIVYLLSNAFDALFLVCGAFLTGIDLPLNALQILFVNFFSDSFPAITFAFEEGTDGSGAKPRKLDRSIFDPEMKFIIFVIGTFTSVLLFFLYWFLLKQGLPQELVRSFIFASFATYTLFLTFSLKSLRESIFSYNPFSNHYLTAGVGIGVFLTAFVVYVPSMQKIFGTVPLPLFWALGVLAVGLANMTLVEFGKWLFRRRKT